MLCTVLYQFLLKLIPTIEPEMMIHLSFETWGDSVPMRLKFKQSVNSLCTYFFIVMVFFFVFDISFD